MGALDSLFADMGQALGGDSIILGALIFMAFAFIAFRSGLPMSGMIFVGILLMGALVVLGLLDIMFFGIVLLIGAVLFWKAVLSTGG